MQIRGENETLSTNHNNLRRRREKEKKTTTARKEKRERERENNNFEIKKNRGKEMCIYNHEFERKRKHIDNSIVSMLFQMIRYSVNKKSDACS